MPHVPSRYALARQAVRTFPRSERASRQSTNTLRRKWIAAVVTLGVNWRGLAIRLEPQGVSQ